MEVWVKVLLYATLTAVATGLGALPFAFLRKHVKVSNRWLGIGNAVAAALMMAASFGMIYEGIEYGLMPVMLGVFTGLVFILLSEKFMNSHDIKIGQLASADARKVLLIMGVMTIHSFAEGVAVGVSFGPDIGFGIFIALALAVHNIPEGLAISLVMVPRGIAWWKAGLWSVFSSLPQPLMAVPAFLFASYFAPFLPFGLGFAAGAMLWMSFSELLPEAIEEIPNDKVATIATIAIALMIMFQYFIE